MKFFSFSKKYRLLSRNIIFNKYNLYRSMFFNIYYLKNNLVHPRICISIKKKIIKLSNKRNLLKRLIKEHFRIIKFNILNFDYIFKLSSNINFKENINIVKKDIKSILFFFRKII